MVNHNLTLWFGSRGLGILSHRYPKSSPHVMVRGTVTPMRRFVLPAAAGALVAAVVATWLARRQPLPHTVVDPDTAHWNRYQLDRIRWANNQRPDPLASTLARRRAIGHAHLARQRQGR